MAKPAKIAKILGNNKLTDDMTIQVGEESFTLGELRLMDRETEGGSTAELEQIQKDIDARESQLVMAQNNTIEILRGVADHIGVELDDLVGGQWKGKVKGKATASTTGDTDPELAGLDDATKAAVLTARKLMAPEISKLQKELADTRKALGIGISVSLDQYYEDTWEKLSDKVPKGADGKPLVKLDMKTVLEHAAKNNLNDARGRKDLKKAFSELTQEARTQQMILEAEERGAKRREQELQIGAVTKPGASRPAHITKPPVDDKGRTKTLDQVLADAANDTEIWQNALSGGFGAA